MSFRYKRRDSVTQILQDTGLPSIRTIMFNSAVTFKRSWCISRNDNVKRFNSVLSVWYVGLVFHIFHNCSLCLSLCVLFILLKCMYVCKHMITMMITMMMV